MIWNYQLPLQLIICWDRDGGRIILYIATSIFLDCFKALILNSNSGMLCGFNIENLEGLVVHGILRTLYNTLLELLLNPYR